MNVLLGSQALPTHFIDEAMQKEIPSWINQAEATAPPLDGFALKSEAAGLLVVE